MAENSLVRNVVYLGGLYERRTQIGSPDELVHYIVAGTTVAIHTIFDDNLPATDKSRYLHRGAQHCAYAPWARSRASPARPASWSSACPSTPTASAADQVPIQAFVGPGGQLVTANNRSLAALSLARKKPTNVTIVEPNRHLLNRLKEKPILDIAPVPGSRSARNSIDRGMNSKQKLIPVEAPWQISPSTPNLQLMVSEAEEQTRLKASVNFPKGDMKRIILSFGRSLYARFACSWSDSEVVREDHYDWSAVPDIDLDNLESSQKEFWANWERLGVCPDPNMYKVVGSPWLSEVEDNRTLQHFLVLGHDAYVEVLAEGWNWEVVSEVHVSSLKDLSITDDP